MTTSEEDVLPAGDAAKGYISVTTHPSGTEFPVIQEIERVVYAAGKGNMDDPKRVGSVYYNLGVLNGIIQVEAIRNAQAKFGNKAINGEEGRWGLENLSLDEARLTALGACGLAQPLKLSCSDHEGGGAVKFQQWDGTKRGVISDWIASDRALLRPRIEESAAKYAKEKGITPRDCALTSAQAG